MSNMDTIDISDWKLQGRELIDEVNKAHASTQGLIIRPYPTYIQMNANQFDQLIRMSGIVDMYGSETDQMFKTDTGFIMEVRVK